MSTAARHMAVVGPINQSLLKPLAEQLAPLSVAEGDSWRRAGSCPKAQRAMLSHHVQESRAAWLHTWRSLGWRRRLCSSALASTLCMCCARAASHLLV